MGSRLIQRRTLPSDRRREELRTLATIIAAVGLPLILAFILVAADMRSDLSELRPARHFEHQSAMLIGWPELKHASEHSLSRVRMLGYMMDGYRPSRDGDQLKMFILMPEAGQFLHPAHRIPDEMVEVWLARPVPFQYRRLVWVSGTLRRVAGRPEAEKALYAIQDATVETAVQREITLWFKP